MNLTTLIRAEVREYVTPMFEEILTRIDATNAKLDGFRTELKNDIEAARAEFRQEIQAVRTEVQEVRAELKGEIQEVRTEVQDIRTEVQDIRTEVQDVRTEVRDIRSEVTSMNEKMDKVMAFLGLAKSPA